MGSGPANEWRRKSPGSSPAFGRRFVRNSEDLAISGGSCAQTRRQRTPRRLAAGEKRYVVDRDVVRLRPTDLEFQVEELAGRDCRRPRLAPTVCLPRVSEKNSVFLPLRRQRQRFAEVIPAGLANLAFEVRVDVANIEPHLAGFCG